jgi:hypothetical protein
MESDDTSEYPISILKSKVDPLTIDTINPISSMTTVYMVIESNVWFCGTFSTLEKAQQMVAKRRSTINEK